jgi:hypothetical protein
MLASTPRALWLLLSVTIGCYASRTTPDPALERADTPTGSADGSAAPANTPDVPSAAFAEYCGDPPALYEWCCSGVDGDIRCEQRVPLAGWECEDLGDGSVVDAGPGPVTACRLGWTSDEPPVETLDASGLPGVRFCSASSGPLSPEGGLAYYSECVFDAAYPDAFDPVNWVCETVAGRRECVSRFPPR